MVQRDRSLRNCWEKRGCVGLATTMLLGIVPAMVARAQSAPATITISGSSTVFPITTEAIRAFRQTGAGKDLRFDLKETGTSAGFRDFCSGRVPISNASRPISSKELKACAAKGITFIELPIAFDALTVAVNPRNSWAKAISTQELSILWSRKAQGRILRWNQVNSSWPASPIKLCGPGKDSGTFEYFNKAVNGSTDNSRSDFTSSEDDNVVVNCVAGNPQALGYVGFGWYAANSAKLRALAIKGPKGAELPSIEAVQKERYIPLARPLFIYVNNEMMLKQENVRRFVTFYLQQGPKMVKAARFIPLQDSTYRLVESKLYRHVLGTSFGGDLPIGLTIGQALDRSFDQTKQPQFRVR
ncbi:MULTISPECIES: PstS family phosphate ABC transporter substrate-binding protein [unclassified Synechococcus]|uniref:PstS family phosphate ABC transporter substrate-binding protein n=1 Tax=unclassified Synechococcus TaxID=2626047 RepID=UPI0021A5AC30|nr:MULTISPECIES: PstS family phosphate ABC transporter substrate-binding protein [unclassified Synechococcus]MCT0213974.1 PstS family phosphate ABC transporter substrate-binding protein [Synechococcus sp. CS-1326]MCT0233550.1 PstS family phosphate ABC transporter substrate-binding protein [Synechococcus sp. CS-1327]